MVEMPDVGVKVLVEVESHNGKAKFEGIVLHPAADGHLTLKLANGYNASYAANDILSVEILEAPQNSDIQQSNDFEFDDKLPRVFLITKSKDSTLFKLIFRFLSIFKLIFESKKIFNIFKIGII